MTPLERTRLEKALADHGFDLTPVLEGDWLVGSSTMHASCVWLRYEVDGAIRLAGAHPGVRSALVKEGLPCGRDSDLPASAVWEIRSADFHGFYTLLGRFAALARSLPSEVAKRFREATKALPQNTEVERLVVQRIGQNLFREALIDYWQGRCAVTGVNVAPLLRASHIKPWAVCASDEERLDVFNGLLLTPNLDALFDGGWITFDRDGALQVSPRLTSRQRNLLGLGAVHAVKNLGPEHQRYLQYHRDFIFQ